MAVYLISGGFLVSIMLFRVGDNYSGLYLAGCHLSFWGLYALNLALYLILFMFDTLVIDGLVIGQWRPGFIHLPDAMSAESMREHIKRSVPAGTLFGLVISLLCTVISFYLFW
jgi:hypothetical protein